MNIRACIDSIWRWTAFRTIILLLIVSTSTLHAQFNFSDGLYRMPYENGAEVIVNSNIWNHSPPGKYDITADEGNQLIVAAAPGWVRWIEESFNVDCHPAGNGQPCCWQFNNFVIVEHANGEWSGYTHIQFGSATIVGLTLNEWVEAGEALGIEGTVGCSSGPHLHFEVARPDPGQNPFDTIGGFLNGELLIPVLCGFYPVISFLDEGITYTAGPCDDNCFPIAFASGSLAWSDVYVARGENQVVTDDDDPVIYENGSYAQYRSAGNIVLRPGFHAQSGTRFRAFVTGCNEQ